jgi:B12-binding domain/radical SAM domain protein
MAETDIIFVHPPSIYDFRKRGINFGLTASTVSSSSVFESFPIGFLSLSHALREAGYTTRIVNLATGMLFDDNLNIPEYLSTLSARYFGLSLHWIAHGQGFLEVARILKRVHPTIPIIAGGISATYFREELIAYPEVDYVIAGDSGELPLLELIRRLGGCLPLDSVPNLSWKVEGMPRHNAMTHIPQRLDVRYDYRILLEDLVDFGRPEELMMTAQRSIDTIATIIPFVRGCRRRCRTCGGSNFALGRRRLGVRSVESVIEDIAAAKALQSKTISIYGDIRQADWERYLALLAGSEMGSGLRYELYWGAKREFIQALALASPGFTVMMSPESHDEGIRRRIGRAFSNDDLETTIECILEFGGKVRLFFMIGLPGQDRESVHGTLEYIDRLLKKYNSTGEASVDANIGPLAPFIDPGSPAFENPGAFGYRLKFRSLRDHIATGYASDWRCMFNYESETLPVGELADVSWEAARQLTAIRAGNGLIDSRQAAQTDAWLEYGLEYERRSTAFQDFRKGAAIARVSGRGEGVK